MSDCKHCGSSVAEAVQTALEDPDAKIFGLTKKQILELERWRTMKNIPLLWVDHYLSTNTKAAVRFARQEAFQEMLRIGDDNMPELNDIHPQLKRFLELIRSRAKQEENA